MDPVGPAPPMLHKAAEHQGSAGQHSDNTTITTPSEAHHNIVINTTAGMVAARGLMAWGPGASSRPRTSRRPEEHQ